MNNKVTPDVADKPVISVFQFVSFGSSLEQSYRYEFDPEDYDPDEAYIQACEEFKHFYPRVSAAVFHRHKDEGPSTLYDIYVSELERRE